MIPYKIFNTLSRLKRKLPGGNPQFWSIRQKMNYESCRKEINELLKFVVLKGYEARQKNEI